MFETQLDVYKLVFMAELLIAEALFVYKLKKRNHFSLRVVLCISACFLLAYLFPVLAYNAVFSSVMFLIFFLFTIFALRFCFNEITFDIIFCGIAAYTVQHLAYEIFNYVCMVSGLYDAIPGIYSNAKPGFNGYAIILYGAIYGIIYWLMFLLFGDRINQNENITLKGKALLGLAALIILVNIVLNAIAAYHSYLNKDLVYSFIIVFYNVLCCILALITQFGLLSRKNLEGELKVVCEMRNKEHQQYLMSKESIDLINQKCHDIKHYIRSFGQQKSLSEEMIKDLQESVSIYDTSVKTGNKAFDVILSEKKLYCKINDINLTCMAAGAKLDFMADSEIYVLFGNMLDNAIEAVMKLDKDKRIIGLVVVPEKNFLSISCYNYYDGNVKLDKDNLVTSKVDTNYHGFGLKSIRMIVEGFGGNVSFVMNDDEFTLNILLPLNNPKGEKNENVYVENKIFISKRKLLLIIVPLISIAIYICVGLIIVSSIHAATG